MGNAAQDDFGGAFARGAIVLATLNSPREKFWGMVLTLDATGVSLRGIDLLSFDNFIQLVKSGERATASVVFFPMHRIERMEIDARNGDIPSLAEQFTAKTGTPTGKLFQEEQER